MEKRKSVNTKRGVVVSDKGRKTVQVEVQWMYKDPKYGKYLNRTTRLGVHDERDEAKVGDLVEIASCRPLSKTKNWRLIKILEKAVQE